MNRQKLLTWLTSPYSLWVVVQIVLWSMSLYTIALSIRLLGIGGGLVGAVLAGLIIGVGQAWSLQFVYPVNTRQWIGYTVFGTVLGVAPIALFFLWILLASVLGVNSVLMILGGVFGMILGGIQAIRLYQIAYDKALIWVIANGIAGALCAPLSLTGSSLWLPVFCSAGPLMFGLVTAIGLRYIIHHIDIE